MRYLIFAALLACGSPTDNPDAIHLPNGSSYAVSAASLSGVDVVPKVATIVATGQVQLCTYFRFNNGKAAMRNQDAPGCSKDFVARYTSSQRSITSARQRFVDEQCITWSSSNVAVATVSSEACAARLAMVGGFMAIER